MKRIFKYTLLFALVFTLFQIQTIAQSEEEMKAWEAYMTPGEMHKIIAGTDGEWVSETTMWMDPQGQPIMSKGKCTNKMIFGGRYQVSHFEGDFMGKPMEGRGIMAYDNLKKEFENVWIDNMGSGIMISTGTYDPTTKTISLSGNLKDPTTGKDCNIRQTLKIVDKDNHIMTMYMTPQGESERKTMEIKFSRKS